MSEEAADVEIRLMVIEDYPEMLALWQATPGMGLSSADAKESIASYLERNPGHSFIAREEEELIGAVLCGHDGRRGFIHHLAVAASHRREGLGGMLVERCITSLRSAAIQKCHIFVYTDNHQAIDFWSATGWVMRTELEIMSKDIPPVD